MLYSRQANIGLIAAETVAQSSVGFRQVPIVDDPYVFAVPSSIGLGQLRDLDAMPADARRVLNSCIQFHFGTPHTLRIQQWYQRVLPSHRTVAHCRTYEVALGLVHAGFGVCLLPALTAFLVEGALDGIDFFATDHGTRHTVAMVADQYLRHRPVQGLHRGAPGGRAATSCCRRSSRGRRRCTAPAMRARRTRPIWLDKVRLHCPATYRKWQSRP